MVGLPLTVDPAGEGGSRDTGRLEGAGPSMVVGTRGIIEEVGGGELGVAEGMGMEEKEVLIVMNVCTCMYECMCLVLILHSSEF